MIDKKTKKQNLQKVDPTKAIVKPKIKKPFSSLKTKIATILLAVLIGIFGGVIIWYEVQLRPVSSDADKLIKITIVEGSSSSSIGKLLQNESIIKNAKAFEIYVRLHNKNNNLQAGSYRLSPAESVPEIVKHLTNGSVDTFNITFLPGNTLEDNVKVLEEAGYSEDEINTALDKTYTGSIFDTKPDSADLEGYIYGDTYNFNSGATVEEILQRSFDEFSKKIETNDIVAGLQKQGLTLYEGITLASIIQREIGSPTGQSQPTTDQRQVAQVFLKRLDMGMALGSDVTYQYIADKLGIERDPDIDSPYNTRKYTGLPPGPISVPDITSLLAVVNPTDTDYLYFLSGDDDITYFAKTYEEHEKNITDHCQKKCTIT